MKHDRQNQILQEHQKNAIHLFIQFLLACQIQSIYSLIYNAICDLKHTQNPDLKASSIANPRNLGGDVSKVVRVDPRQIRHESEDRGEFRPIGVTVAEAGDNLIRHVSDAHVEHRKAPPIDGIEPNSLGNLLADRRIRDDDDWERK